MWLYRSLWAFPLAVALALSVAACGYRPVSEAQWSLPDDVRTLAVEDIENPTLEYWLEPELRALVREEFIKRDVVSWASPEDAEGLLRMRIERLQIYAKLKDPKERTQKYAARLKFSASITRRRDGSLVWESGPITIDESVTRFDRDEARRRVVELAVRRMADRLGQAY